MSSYLDKKYINLVSNRLEKFKWKKDNLANCRCPICGDSEVNKNKARGYFFVSENSYIFKCHNCGASFNIYKFLEIISPPLFQEYCLERFKDKAVNVEERQVVAVESKFDTPQYDLIKNLPDTHEAVKFIQNRKLPIGERNIGYTEMFGDLAKKFNPDYKLLNDKRIIIPIYDEHNRCIGLQGRSLTNTKPKYITLKKNEKLRLIYGIEKVDKSKPIIIVEGPFDSLFLPNAIACLGVGNFLEIREKFQNQNLIFVLDNEPRNKSVADTIKKLIDKNEKVCIFPQHIKEKDINDMVLNGMNVHDIIEDNTHSGPSAMLAYTSWRKCK
jgi:DNA primase